MRYLTAGEILVLHARVVDATGGSHGVRDPHLLASIAFKPQARFRDRELYKGAFTKAAVLLEAIANYHVFVDGNKRTSLIATARFLFLNGYELVTDNKDTERAVLAVAKKEIELKELAVWLKKNVRKM